ncbi:hypothetical protein [Chloroflexus aurantiacus]
MMSPRAEWVDLSARNARDAEFGVRQPCCRSSRPHDPMRVRPVTLPVTVMLWVIVMIVEASNMELEQIMHVLETRVSAATLFTFDDLQA